jgi:hypothetical protein
MIRREFTDRLAGQRAKEGTRGHQVSINSNPVQSTPIRVAVIPLSSAVSSVEFHNIPNKSMHEVPNGAHAVYQ